MAGDYRVEFAIVVVMDAKNVQFQVERLPVQCVLIISPFLLDLALQIPHATTIWEFFTMEILHLASHVSPTVPNAMTV